MARHVFVLTGLLVVLMAAGRAGIHAGSSLDGPVIPVPLEATVQQAGSAAASQAAAESAAPVIPAPGELVSAIEMPGTAFQLLYLFQHDTDGKAGDAAAKDKPVSVVLWKALEVGAKVSPRAVRERIAENSAAPSMTSKAVYTLQSDFRLQKVALSNNEISHLFHLLEAGNGEAIAADSLWKGKVAGQVKEVEWLDDGLRKNKSKSKDKQAKAKSSRSSKVSKAGKPSKTAHARKPAAKSTKAQAKASSRVSRSSRKASGA